MRRHALWVLMVLTSAGAASADPQTRGVVELFTSQGCSSCPAADDVLAELSRDHSVVALSMPIDYSGLSRLERHACLTRQCRPPAGVRPRTRRPGGLHAAGGGQRQSPPRRRRPRRHHPSHHSHQILTRRRSRFRLSIRTSGSVIEVAVAGASPTLTTSAEVWLCALATAVPVTIERGENRGQTVTYHNVVRRFVKLGEFAGKARTFSVPTTRLSEVGADAAAVLVQAGTGDSPNTILGAAVASLHSSFTCYVGSTPAEHNRATKPIGANPGGLGAEEFARPVANRALGHSWLAHHGARWAEIGLHYDFG